MKLTRLEWSILRDISSPSPTLWDKSEADEIIAVDESPLMTKDQLAARRPKVGAAPRDVATRRLIQWRYAVVVHLFGRQEFSEIRLDAGKPYRSRLTNPGSGGVDASRRRAKGEKPSRPIGAARPRSGPAAASPGSWRSRFGRYWPRSPSAY